MVPEKCCTFAPKRRQFLVIRKNLSDAFLSSMLKWRSDEKHFQFFSTPTRRCGNSTPDVASPILDVDFLPANRAHREAAIFLAWSTGDGAVNPACEAAAVSGNDVGAVSGRSTHGIWALRQGRWYVKTKVLPRYLMNLNHSVPGF